MKIAVKGMMCAHCSARVQKALETAGANSVAVDLNGAAVTFEGISVEAAIAAIEDVGYVAHA